MPHLQISLGFVLRLSNGKKKTHQPSAFQIFQAAEKTPDLHLEPHQSAHRSRDPDFEWAKKTLMTGDGTKCGDHPVGDVGDKPCITLGRCI